MTKMVFLTGDQLRAYRRAALLYTLTHGNPPILCAAGSLNILAAMSGSFPCLNSFIAGACYSAAIGLGIYNYHTALTYLIINQQMEEDHAEKTDKT